MFPQDFLTSLLIKMAFVTIFVVAAARLAERSRPAIAALIATLPISIGPIFVLLSLEHDSAFLGSAALKSIASVGATLGFIAVYANSATRFGPLKALSIGYLYWAPMAFFVHSVDWSLSSSLAFLGLVAAVSECAMRWLKEAPAPVRVERRWWDIPVRATAVALLVALVTGLSHALGSSGVGTLANFPIVMSSLSLITHFRLGGRQTAAMLANTTGGMLGVGAGLVFVHLAIVPMGAPVALPLALGISLIWNFGLYLVSRKNRTG